MNFKLFFENERKIQINYLYFGLLFFLLISMNSYNLFLVKSSLHPKIFFLFYSLGQCVLEFCILIFVGYLIKALCSTLLYYIYIGLTFLLYLSHPLDFVLNRILDLSFLETIDFVLDENWDNFLQMLYASGIPLIVWASFFLIILAIPFVGIGFYFITDKFCQRKKLFFCRDKVMQTLFCTPLALIALDFSISPTLNPGIYHSYLKALPWKTTFIQPENMFLDLQYTLKKPKTENEYLKTITSWKEPLKKNPNIFLFIVESLREDFIDQQTAPNLTQFKNENLFFSPSISNANATQISWFSLFHSEYPLHWSHVKNSNWKTGSMPIKLLKELGYQIHVFSSAELYYYEMEKLLFGTNHKLANSFYMFPHHHPIKSSKTDRMALNLLEKKMIDNKMMDGKNLFVIFLDSTHFDYSWEDDHPINFLPISDQLDYFKAHHSEEDMSRIKNRYRNAISYIDSLFGKFTHSLKSQGIYEDSVIIFTGDHGEEFYDQGKLFHASHLSNVQTTIPLYYKFGKNERKANNIKERISSHMDVFPSIFDYLFEKNLTKGLFSGNSVFDSEYFPYTITARYNASRSPYEFFIHNGEKKLLLRFTNRKDIFSSQKIEILALKDLNDHLLLIQESQNTIEKEFSKALNLLFFP